ncbi:hypothetical protein [uncultured Brachybacterium sp.]|uniref:hypothetical protein n=1 Tax=uncultured Brachybacterium sp. TaxID=189680 RepID=UPI0026258607|nr:hypothetical protein [uncultured Brachybacterium sp.]
MVELSLAISGEAGAMLNSVGALAVLCFVLFLALGLLKGWNDPSARLLLRAAGALGIVCDEIGVLLPVVGV